MPRVSEEYRQARREEIARAALRVLERKGVRDTSIADIVAESGLSTGAIYSHFTNKGELARYIISEFMLPRLDAIAASAEVRTPRQIIELMLTAISENGISPAVILQFWAEGSMPGDIRDELLRTIVKLRRSLTGALLPWARRADGGRGCGGERSPTRARSMSRRSRRDSSRTRRSSAPATRATTWRAVAQILA